MTVLFSEDPMPETKAAPPGPASQGAPPREISPTVNPKGEMLSESSPSRYIAKVSFATGKEILRPIDPDDLLVHAHRDKNPIDVTAQYLSLIHISEPTRRTPISYAVFCLKKKKTTKHK